MARGSLDAEAHTRVHTPVWHLGMIDEAPGESLHAFRRCIGAPPDHLVKGRDDDEARSVYEAVRSRGGGLKACADSL